MDYRNSNLLDEALGLEDEECGLRGKVIAIQDCVETSGAFVFHQLIKRLLVPNSSNAVVFLAFSRPFSHYDRILRKLGCNLAAQRDDGRFLFFDMLRLQYPDKNEDKSSEDWLVAVFRKILQIVRAFPQNNKNYITIMIDDISLIEVAVHGSSGLVLDFLHYCQTLTSEFGCSLVTLNHADIYSSVENCAFLLQMEYLADVLVKIEPLVTGLAADVHGQLTVLNRGVSDGKGNLKTKTPNFRFKVKENVVEYFYPGSRT
ncbi:hypothetical protein K2173_020629 [Erythroxylum novogranatense]|uniref:Elongator complex protein 6 n=1 Tax=Erythroxylum novogranatense TaxID=1862640 RepID=A0AAV8TJI5_9ROSI|nr:hypothetical protein K2173_020629 [Erythroxylum novogranatense]